MLCNELSHTKLGVGKLLSLNRNIGGLTTKTRQRLMHHDASIRKAVTLASGSRRQQELAHRGSEAEADSRHITRNELHRVVNCHTCSHRSAGRIDVQPNITVWIFAFEIQQLGAELIRNLIVHVRTEQNNTILQQSVKHITSRVDTTL